MLNVDKDGQVYSKSLFNCEDEYDISEKINYFICRLFYYKIKIYKNILIKNDVGFLRFDIINLRNKTKIKNEYPLGIDQTFKNNQLDLFTVKIIIDSVTKTFIHENSSLTSEKNSIKK